MAGARTVEAPRRAARRPLQADLPGARRSLGARDAPPVRRDPGADEGDRAVPGGATSPGEAARDAGRPVAVGQERQAGVDAVLRAGHLVLPGAGLDLRPVGLRPGVPRDAPGGSRAIRRAVRAAGAGRRAARPGPGPARLRRRARAADPPVPGPVLLGLQPLEAAEAAR